MPITITPTQPGNRVGPGLITSWQSSFIGPIETGSQFLTSITTDSEGSIGVVSHVQTTTSQLGSYTWYSDTSEQDAAQFKLQPRSGDSVFVQVKLLAPDHLTVLDSGTQAATWSSTDGLGQQISDQQTTVGGGLTSEQALQLSQTHASTFPDQLVDNLTLQPLTSGPTQGPVNSGLLHFTFGVIVRIANVPEDIRPGTPDGNYWWQDLAVVRVFRGADLWLRVPIHTSSKIVPFIEQNVVAGIAQVTGSLWLLNMSVQVNFRQGVTGEVFLMVFP